MKKFRNAFFYIAVTGGFSALMYWIVILGTKLEQGRDIVLRQSEKSQWAEFLDSIFHNLEYPLAILLAQIVTIILAARLLGWVCKKIGQPAVIGEIIAGIILGPSLIGFYFPEFSSALFPAQSLGNLQFISQIGLILFMFIIGMELDLQVLKNKAHEAVVISHASIIIPFALGLGLAYFIYPSFAPQGVQFSSFGLFLGISMSVTAFPVLARIVQERNLNKTRIGTIVITCAAADDITAWSLLAAIIAIVKAGSFVSSIYTILLAIGYVLFMIKLVRPFLKRVGNLHSSRESLSKPIIAIFFLSLLLSAYATEVIGIHALFGAFLAGAIMPENEKFRSVFIDKVEDISIILLLPLFFVFTGLRTEIGLLNDPYLWKITALIILVAVAGKFVGSAVAAKFVGQTWKDSLIIGALMNTRGLMELVILNIGYDLGVLSPEIFAMMVIMALVTTFMTGPSLDLISRIFKSRDIALPDKINEAGKYKILISYGNPERGKTLLRLAKYIINNRNGNSSITVMHLSPTNELNRYNLDKYEKASFAPIIEESKVLNQKITTFFKASNDIETDIAEVANKGDFDLLLIGVGHSIFDGSILGNILGFTTRFVNPDRFLDQVTGKESFFENSPMDERTRSIISKSKISVGVLIDKDLKNLNQILVFVNQKSDLFLISYVQRLSINANLIINLLDPQGKIEKNTDCMEKIQSINSQTPHQIRIISPTVINSDFFRQIDLTIVSFFGWKKLLYKKESWLSDISSTMILVNRN